MISVLIGYVLIVSMNVLTCVIDPIPKIERSFDVNPQVLLSASRNLVTLIRDAFVSGFTPATSNLAIIGSMVERSNAGYVQHSIM